MISIIDLLLNERIETKQKPVYAYGTDHDIYLSKKDSTKVFKVVKPGQKNVSDQEHNWIKIFRENPKLFPKVYRSSDRGAELEKLNTNQAKKEYDQLDKAIDPIGSFDGLLKMAGSGQDINKPVSKYIEYLEQNNPDLLDKFLSFIKLVTAVSKSTGIDRLDIHIGNFGYDYKQGKLKMLDI